MLRLQKDFFFVNKQYSKAAKLTAFRNAIYEQVKNFREKELKNNKRFAQLSEKNPYNVHTEHIVPFHLLLSDFCRDNQLKLREINIRETERWGRQTFEIIDTKILRAWQKYHQKYSQLRLITKEENLAKAAEADLPLYQYKKARGETYD